MDVRALPIEDYVLDPKLNLRDQIDDETVQRYAEAVDRMPPVTVFEVEGRWLLADGFHRHAAAQAGGKKTLSAEILLGSFQDALEYAALANLRHGLPLNRHERRRAVEVAVTLHPDWSDRKLADHLGVGRNSVTKIRKELTTSGLVPNATNRVGSDGKLYSMGIPRDPNERLPRGPEVVHEDDVLGRVELAGVDDGSLPPKKRKGERAAAAAKSSGVGADDPDLAPWEGPDQFATGDPGHFPAQTVQVASSSEALTMIARQIREITTWIEAEDFAESYQSADSEAQAALQDAVAALTARARKLKKATT